MCSIDTNLAEGTSDPSKCTKFDNGQHFLMIYILCKLRKFEKDVSKSRNYFHYWWNIEPIPRKFEKVRVSTFHYFLSKLDRKMSAVWYAVVTSNTSLIYNNESTSRNYQVCFFRSLAISQDVHQSADCFFRKWKNLSNNSEVCHVLPYPLLSSQLWGSLEHKDYNHGENHQ